MQIDTCFKGLFQTSPEVYEEGWAIQVVLSDEEVAQITAAYDPASSTSPSVTVCRPIVRAILDAIIAKES
jgi:hypothetical protein